ncbi:MAG: MBL fold metallo-hydrolase [Campylobacterales bacterium]|nr:MBL fold metallo-hydrolase [Campylobacterales bacterium]
MGKDKILFDDGTHKCVMFSIDDESHEESFLAVNQFLLIQNGAGIVIDPGSAAIFHELCEAIERYIPLENLRFVFFSHQDPDVAGSISEWSVATSTRFVMSGLWTRFMTHYGVLDMERIFALPDKGIKIPFGEGYLQFLPAHFMHSPGNFSLYDSQSKILFSGDIGAAVMPAMSAYKEISNFESHLPYLEGFHRRYMAGNIFCKAWVNSLDKLDVTMIAPQHGAVFKDENVQKFLEWLHGLKCGGDLIENLY